MATNKTIYTCSACGAQHPKWGGKCSTCGAWNTLEEGTQIVAKGKANPARSSAFQGLGHGLTPIDLRTKEPPPVRVSTTMPECDRVLGGGLVEGSVVLLAGDPGAGKSTLLMQILAALSKDRTVLYASGEESANQIQMRAERLGVADSAVQLITSNDAIGIAGVMERLPRGSIVAIDSLHAMDCGADSAPGSVAQVKAASALFVPLAKSRGITTLLINHVTKEGAFAGPQLLRHAVDVSLMLQNDTSQGYMRVLRADKNRFGADDEVGLFDMTAEGLAPIDNPSAFFLEQRASDAFGTAIFAAMEGTRPMMVEVQALVTPSLFGTGRRQTSGWETPRMHMLLATIQARLGFDFADKDVYVNVAGGMRITDPGMDTAAALAIISAYLQRPLRPEIAAFGEIGLAGEVRAVMRPESRLKEAVGMEFSTILCPTFMKGTPKEFREQALHIDRLARVLPMLDRLFLPPVSV